MKRTREKKHALLAALLAAAMLAGCGGSASDPAGGTASSGSGAGGTTLTVAWWGNQTRNERTQQVLDLYAGSGAGVSFDGQFAEWADYWTRLSTASAGHTLADIVQMDYSYLQQYVSNGLLVDLTPYVEDGTIDVSGISDTTLDSGRIGDGLYAIPLGVNAPALVYNKTLLDENGIQVKDNMTLDEFYELCRTVYEKTGYKTDVFYGNGADYLAYYLRGEGTTLYGDGELAATEEELTGFFDIYAQGIREGWMCSPAIYAERSVGTPEQMPLVYGSSPSTMSWCAFTWTNGITSLRNAAPEGVELAVTTWPAADPTAADYLKPSMFFSITVDSKSPDEAAKFINYWTNDIEANEILLGERGVPISSAVADGISPLMDSTSQEAAAFINDVVTPNSSTIDAPSPDGSAEVIEAVNQLVERVCYEQITPAEAAASLAATGRSALGQ